MREFLDERVDNLAAAVPGPDARLRAALAVTSLLGLTVARHLLALAEISDAELRRTVRPWLTDVLALALTEQPQAE